MFDLPTFGDHRASGHESAATHEVLVLESATATDRAEWNSFVERTPGSTVFHRHEWVAAIEAGLGYEPCHVEVRKDGNLVGLLPQFVMDLPKVPFRQIRSMHPGFGGPVIGTDREDVFEHLVASTAEQCSGRRILHEIRGCTPALLQYNDPLRRAGYRPARYKGRFVLDCDRTYDEIREGMHRSRRRGLRQGLDTDHTIEEEPLTADSIDRLVAAHDTHMSSVGGDPFPRAFFESLTAMEDRVLLLALYFEGEYAGSFVHLLDEARDAVHLLVAALPPDYYDHRLSEVLHDATIRWTIEHGYGRYDLGGGGGDFTNGIFRFKEQFGGDLSPNFYWERGFGPIWPVLKRGRSAYLRSRSRGPTSG